MSATYINAAVCAGLFYTCFCRMVRTDTQTEVAVRIAFCVLAAAAAACGLAPFGVLAPCLPAQPPTAAQIFITLAMVLVQALTARFWRDGVPAHFQCQLTDEDRKEVHP